MYVIAPINDVKGLHDYPEYQEALGALENQARVRAKTLWLGAQDGGIMPTGQQYGIGPFRKNDMAGDTSDSTASGSYTFRKNFTATAWQDIFNYNVRKDQIHAFAGFLMTDDVLRILQFRMELGQVRFPILDIQEAFRYDRFGVILKTDQGAELVADPSSRVLIRAYVDTVGIQRVTPLGLQLFRRSDMVITET